MFNIPLVIIVIIGLLFMYFMFFAKKEKFEHLDTKTPTIINYNTDWCGYSRRLQPVWTEFTNKMKEVNPNIKVVDMKCDVDENKETCEKADIEGFPTIIYYKEDGTKKVFTGERTVESLLDFVKQ